MMSNPFYLLSVVVGSLLAFFTATFVVEILVKFLGIKNHRIRSILWLLPPLSLVFNQYSLAYWINPLSCASCVQKLMLELFFPQLKAHLAENQISLIHYLGQNHQHSFFFVTFVALSLFFALRTIFQAVFSIRWLKSIVKNGVVCTRNIENAGLQSTLKKKNVKIYVSNAIKVPMAAAFPNVIIIPQKTLTLLTQAEFEAVIAHELEHIKTKDPLTRFVTHLIRTLFWWVATGSWVKKIEQEQEMACDQKVLSYGLDAESIASALVKVTKQVKSEKNLCYFTSHSMIDRLQAVLGLYQERPFGHHYFAIALGVGFLLLCAMIV